jgi:hypothetical protein
LWKSNLQRRPPLLQICTLLFCKLSLAMNVDEITIPYGIISDNLHSSFTSNHMHLFNTLMFCRLFADWSVENMFPSTIKFPSLLWWGVLNKTVCQIIVAGLWFIPGTLSMTLIATIQLKYCLNSEAINQRTDNTHPREKKRQTMIYKILHRNERLNYMNHTNTHSCFIWDFSLKFFQWCPIYYDIMNS